MRTKFASSARTDDAQLVGVMDGAFGDEHQFAGLAAQFPNVRFEAVGADWPERPAARMHVLLAPLDAASVSDIDAAARRLKKTPAELKVVVLLRNADVSTTRLLMREGATDVIPAPASETAIAVTLDKLLGPQTTASGRRQSGEVVAVMKAGGGVGATALAVQAAALLSHKGASVCLADLDLQFGAASVYLDMPEAATVADCLANGAGLADVDFKSLLSRHRSGLSLLAAPRQVTPLEALSPQAVETLLNVLRRSFGVVLLDLPSVWTAWTNRALQMADRIVLVTQLSVPHMHMLDRQIATLRTQGLEGRNLTLVCNAPSPEQSATLSLKAAERALSRDFDVVVPEDRKVMYAAINQGVEIATIRRGTKLEKGVSELAELIWTEQPAEAAAPRRRR